MIYFIGIDPSINSTGICIQKYDNKQKIYEKFLILSGNRKLSKKEQNAESEINELSYVFYDKKDLREFKTDNHLHEYWKSYNLCNLANEISKIITSYTIDNPEHIYINMEGISYGSSIRTNTICDLAGLNYLIRDKFIEQPLIDFQICPPTEIKKFASGNGNCNKEVMVNLFKGIYPEYDIIPKIDDISDAWFMANYAEKRYKK